MIRELRKTFKKAKKKSLWNSVNNFVLHLILLPLLWKDLHQSFTALQFHCKTLAGAISEILGWFWEKLHIWILPSSCSGPYRSACMCLLQKNSCTFQFCSLSVCWGCHASWKDLWTIWVPQEREGTPTSAMKCYFPSLTLSNLVEKKDAILCNGSGQPAPALKLITMTLDELLKAADTVLLYILFEKHILPWAGWRWKAVTYLERGRV